MYRWLRSRQLEGTFPGSCSKGCWITSALRIDRGWGRPTEREWPYSTSWPPVEPPGMDDSAKRHGILAYQRIRSVDECRKALEKLAPVQVALDISLHEWPI